MFYQVLMKLKVAINTKNRICARHCMLDPRTILFTLKTMLQSECYYTRLLEEGQAQRDHCSMPRASGTVSRLPKLIVLFL